MGEERGRRGERRGGEPREEGKRRGRGRERVCTGAGDGSGKAARGGGGERGGAEWRVVRRRRGGGGGGWPAGCVQGEEPEGRGRGRSWGASQLQWGESAEGGGNRRREGRGMAARKILGEGSLLGGGRAPAGPVEERGWGH